MLISIIIVNYNTKELLKNCIKSIQEKTCDVEYEIIVADNASIDDSCEMLEQEFPEVKLIKLPTNLGFGKANNEGLKIAQGKYIFFLNSDCVLYNNAIKILSDFMENNPDCGACGGDLLDEHLNRNAAIGMQSRFQDWIITHSILKFLFPSKYKEIKYYQKNFNRDKSAEVGYITGADLMIRKDVIDKVGAFSPEFFLYFEETELQFRILEAGYKIFYVADSKIIHLEGKSITPNKKLIMLESEFIYFRLTQGKLIEMLVKSASFPKYIRLKSKSLMRQK